MPPAKFPQSPAKLMNYSSGAWPHGCDRNRLLTSFANLRVWQLAICVIEYCIQCAVPASTRGHLEQQNERLQNVSSIVIQAHSEVAIRYYLEKCFKIMNIIEAPSDLNILEQAHSKHSKDEHDEEE